MAIMSPELLRRIRQTVVKPTPTIPNLGNIPKINLPNLDLSKIPQGIKIPSVPKIPQRPAPVIPKPIPRAPIISRPAPIAPRPAPIQPRPAPIVSQPIQPRPVSPIVSQPIQPRPAPIQPRPVSPIVSQPPKSISFTPDPRLRPGGLPPKTLPTPVSRKVTQVPSLMARRDIIEPMLSSPAPTVSQPPSAPAGGTFMASPSVMVYGPDGKMYGSPAAAIAAGVTDYTMTPPGARSLSLIPPTAQTTTVEPLPTPAVTEPTIVPTQESTIAEPVTIPTQDINTTEEPTMATPSNQDMPFVSGATRIEAGLDPLSRQLLFGLDGRGGFIPGAFRAAEKTFFTPEGEARVIPEQIAGFSPEQQAAFELAAQTGTQQPFIEQAMGAYGKGLGALTAGLGEAERSQLGAVADVARGVGAEQALRGAGLAGLLGSLGEAGQIARGATGIFGMGLQDPEALLRGTLGGYDPRMTQQFYDPFEQQVVQQTIQDIMERGEQADIAARASDIARGGESAFGSRARLMAGERERALGRGLGEAISGIRSAGFQRAQQTGLGEFARQLEAQRQAASGLAGLAGQRLGAQQQLGQTLAGLGSTQQQALSQAGQQALGAQQALAGARAGLAGLQQQAAGQLQAGQFGAGQALAGLGGQAQAAQQADISQLLGVGAQQQQQQQAILDAQRRAALQAQQAPLAQYQSLLPFVQAVPAGQQQLTTTFAPPPSPLQAGLGVGLAGLGALGQFLNQPQQRTI